jgi:hypothetical protein
VMMLIGVMGVIRLWWRKNNKKALIIRAFLWLELSDQPLPFTFIPQSNNVIKNIAL